jgi:hypothetical protein
LSYVVHSRRAAEEEEEEEEGRSERCGCPGQQSKAQQNDLFQIKKFIFNNLPILNCSAEYNEIR